MKLKELTVVKPAKHITVSKNEVQKTLMYCKTGQVEINCEDNSQLTIAQVVENNARLTTTFNIGKNAKVKHLIVMLNSTNSEAKTEFNLNGEYAEVKTGGAILCTNSGNVKLDLQVKHSAKNTVSLAGFYSALRGDSSLKVNGNTWIGKDASGSNAFFASHSLLLDKKSKAESIPGLEIEANEVKAGHAASTSKIPEEQLFYCQARGIASKEAEKLLTLAFLQRGSIPTEIEVDELIENKW